MLKTNQLLLIIILGAQPAAINPSKVVLLPPTATTAIPQGNAPIIVPNLSPPPVESPLYEDLGASSKGDGIPQTTGSVETPEFLNDQQMFNYVSSMLLKVLHDCEPLLGVSLIFLKTFDNMSAITRCSCIIYWRVANKILDKIVVIFSPYTIFISINGSSFSFISQPRPMEDVRKRLEIFNKMWQDGKISYSVKVSMAKLSTGSLQHILK